jgi:DNA-binding CsgD family transcriptional regulator
VLTLVGRAADALALGAPLVDRRTGQAHAELCLQLARTAIGAARWAEAESYVKRAGRPDDPRSAVLLADAAFGAGRVDDAAALARDAVTTAERADAAAPLCEALGVVARTQWRTDPAESAAAFGRAAQVAAEHGLTPERVTALANCAMIEALVGDDWPMLHRARELALDAGMLAQVASLDIILADVVMLVDGPRAAEPLARQAVEAATRLRLPGLAAPATIELAGCLAAGGDRTGAAALLDAVRRSGHMRDDLTAFVALAEGVAALVEHDLARAAASMDLAVRTLLLNRTAPLLPPVGAWALLRAATDGGSDEAASVLLAHPGGLARPIAAALDYAFAVTAGREGRPDEATDRLAAADAGLADWPWWRRLLRLVVLESAVADGWGDPVPALRGDLAVHEAAGDELLARTCRDVLRRAGMPVKRQRGTAVPPRLRALGVTSREMEVLVLVARGMTNVEVADRLVLSRRTVDTHVASLLAKTGSATRTELRAWADVR